MKNYIYLFLLIITTSCFSQIFHKDKTIIQGDTITLIKSIMKILWTKGSVTETI